MIYCNLKSYQTLEIQGDNDSIITELTILLMELSRSDRGRMLLLSATEAAQDPKVKNMYEGYRVVSDDSEHETEKGKMQA